MKNLQNFTPKSLLFDYKKKSIECCQIKYFESTFGNYTIIQLNDKKQIVSSFTLKYYSSQLANDGHFFFVRKGLFININYLATIEQRSDGYYAVMHDNATFRLSRRKGSVLLQHYENLR